VRFQRIRDLHLISTCATDLPGFCAEALVGEETNRRISKKAMHATFTMAPPSASRCESTIYKPYTSSRSPQAQPRSDLSPALLRYSPGNLRPPTSRPDPTPKHSPTAMSRTTSEPCNPLMRGLFRLLNSANTPNNSKNAKTLNLVLFTRVPSEKLYTAYHLRYFLIMVSLEGPEKGTGSTNGLRLIAQGSQRNNRSKRKQHNNSARLKFSTAMGSDYHSNAMISALQEPGFRANLLHFRGSGRVVVNPYITERLNDI